MAFLELLVGLFLGVLIRDIIADTKSREQQNLISKLKLDLAWKQHELKCYREFYRIERKKRLDLLDEKYKEG